MSCVWNYGMKKTSNYDLEVKQYERTEKKDYSLMTNINIMVRKINICGVFVLY